MDVQTYELALAGEETIRLALTHIFFIKIICLVLGFFIILLGYKLLLSGVKGEFKFSAAWLNNKADLASASPGLLFLLLGVLLMGYAVLADKGVTDMQEMIQDDYKAKTIKLGKEVARGLHIPGKK